MVGTGETLCGLERQSKINFSWCKTSLPVPQILAIIQGEDEEVMGEYIKENASLLIRSFQENERLEKIRRIKKSITKDEDLTEKFGIKLKYPTAYKTVKDTFNFIWIEKPIQKGSMNIIAYRLPQAAFASPSLEQLIGIRDSIGKTYIPGRLPKTHMITEKAYLLFL